MGEVTPENIMKLEIGLVTLCRQYDHLIDYRVKIETLLHGGAFSTLAALARSWISQNGLRGWIRDPARQHQIL
jgi:hypothetical protein